MSDDLADFTQFMQQREDAARAYVNGDAQMLLRLTTNNEPATFFSPRGDVVEGAESVVARYAADATSFVTGSENTLEIMHMAASDSLAYWVGLQRAQVHLRGQAAPVPFNLRITELFRREGNEWKLIHRHADVLPSA